MTAAGLMAVVTAAWAPAASAAPSPAITSRAIVPAVVRAFGSRAGSTVAVAREAAVAPDRRSPAVIAHDDDPDCTYNGVDPDAGILTVSPGEQVTIQCTGWSPDDQIQGVEGSPIFLSSLSEDDLDISYTPNYTASPDGDLSGTFDVPDPFQAADPNAVCPPSASEVAEGYLRCFIGLVDNSIGGSIMPLNYSGSAPPAPTPAPPAAVFTGIAATTDGLGYWLVDSAGEVFDEGDAPNYGDISTPLNSPINHIVATPDGRGYWLVAGDGGVFAFGDAQFFGSMGGQPLNAPVVDLAPTADGKGYWLVGSDGGIFAFGDAAYFGSMGGKPLNRPVVGLTADDATGGYWEVATDGGIFAFNAPFFGSTGSIRLNRPVNGLAATPDDQGYLFVASDGGIFAYGDATFYGSTGNLTLNAPIVGVATDPSTAGYWLLGSDGGVFAFNAPFFGAG